MALSGERVVATATVSATQNATGNVTNTSYTATMASGSGPPGVAFVAPPSGKVTILFATAGFNSGANDNKTSVQVREGGTVGSGTVVYGVDNTAMDNDMILFTGAATYRIGSVIEVTGLTAGNTYNARMLHRVSAGTGSFLFRKLKVIPDP